MALKFDDTVFVPRRPYPVLPSVEMPAISGVVKHTNEVSTTIMEFETCALRTVATGLVRKQPREGSRKALKHRIMVAQIRGETDEVQRLKDKLTKLIKSQLDRRPAHWGGSDDEEEG